MKKVSRILARGALAVIALALPRPAGATCINTLPVQHGLDSYFTGCPDILPVDGYLFVLGQEATLNSDPSAGAAQKIDFVCEATGVQTGQLIDCAPQAGAPGDGNVIVMFDWGGINLSNGSACPNPTGVPGVGRNVIQVAANDGASLIVTVGFSVDFAYYLVEAAHPVTTGMDISPLACSQNNGLTLVSNTSGLESQIICFQQSAPPVHSDCDPDTVGAILDTCQGGTGTVTVTPGNLYTRIGPCGLAPDLRRSSWTPLATTPGPGGSKCGVVNPPLDNSCLFFGGSSFFGDGVNAPAESPVLTGWMRQACTASAASAGAPRPGCGAAVDEVVIRKAEILKGRLHVDFGTVNEATIVGFNVYAGDTKLNVGLIAARGQGNNDYSFEVGRGALKNERLITVEAVLSNGTTVRTSAFSVK